MPTTNETETLISNYEISSAGSKIPPDVQTLITGIEVDLDTESVGMFSVLLHAGERDQQRFPIIDSDAFKPGNEIKIKMGYGSTLITMIVGEITTLIPEYHDNGAVMIRVNGFDRLYRLGFGRKTRSFRNMKDSDIASQIAQDWQLTPQVDATDTVHDYVLQRNQTDREFLAERAVKLRYELHVEDRTLCFQKTRESDSAVATLTYGENLIEFFPVLSTVFQTSKTEVRSWSVKDKKAISGDASMSDVVSTMAGKKTGGKVSQDIAGDTKRILAGEDTPTKSEAEDLARATMNRSVMDFITGEGRCIGTPGIKAGNVVELKGLGDRFSGLYYVVACTHSIASHGYHTSFTVRRSAA